MRILVGLALAYGALVTWPGMTSAVFVVIAAVALVTGVAGWCPAYALFNITTRKRTA
jgi:hypothetical protein